MADPFLGEIRVFSFGYPPRGWALCNGATLQITQNQALYSLISTTFGSNGQNTFCLPDLQGRVPLAAGINPVSGNVIKSGQKDGTETVILTSDTMPAHTHPVTANNSHANAGTPVTPAAGFIWALADLASDGTVQNAYGASSNTTMGPDAISTSGGSQGHNNMQPYLALNYCIAIVGVYPPRP